MAYGFLLTSTSGYVQIDDTYSNYVVRAYGSTYYPRSISRGTSELVMIRLPYGAAMSINQNVLVDYRIYTPASSVSPSSGNGLRVYNSSGGITFDSGYKHLKLYGLTNLQDYKLSDSYFGYPGFTFSSPVSERPWFSDRIFTVLPEGGAVPTNIGTFVRQNNDNSLYVYGGDIGDTIQYDSFGVYMETLGFAFRPFLYGD